MKPASEFFEGSIDPRFNILNSTINIDASNSRVLIQRRSSNTGSATYLGQTCFNTRQTYFDISSSSDLRQYLPGVCFVLRGYAVLEDGSTPVDRTSVGIPWNSMCMLNGLQVRINSSGTPIEIYSNNRFDVASTIRLICEMSRTQLEGMSESLFTPCFETDADTGVTFSLETQARSLSWLQDVGGFVIKRSILWPLPLLCSFANVPAMCKINRIEFFFDWKNPDQVLFKKTAYNHTPQYLVEDIQCILDQSSMSVIQASMELKESVSKQDTQRFFYRYYDVLETNYVSSGTVLQNSVPNLESAILCFPSTVLGNPNYLQFCMNNLNSYAMMYNGYSVPQVPVQMDVLHRQNNGEAYYMYKKLLKKEFTTNYLPALPYSTGYGAELNPHDDSTYFLFCASFNQSLAPHLSDPGELRCITSQVANADPLICNTNCKVYLIKIRNVGFQVNPDGTCEKFFP